MATELRAGLTEQQSGQRMEAFKMQAKLLANKQKYHVVVVFCLFAWRLRARRTPPRS